MSYRIAILCLAALALTAGEPVFLDLAPAVNVAAEDDGIPGNGAGGWTDEGINDMATSPALPPGVQQVNGVRFRIVDPAATGGKAAIMLQGAQPNALPRSVTVPAGGATGRFIYFVHHGVARPSGMGKEEVVARYTVAYADGTSSVAEMRDGRELRHWWTGAWWDNNGAEAWPVLMAQNPYTAKWRKWIGLWATCWTNPEPGKAIASITLASAGRVVPVLWAITIDDRDYREVIGKDYKLAKPADVPPGGFDARFALERKLIGGEMRRLGLIRGMRSLELIRPDLLAVTIDAAVAGGPGQDEVAARALQDAGRFAVVQAGGVSAPAQVGRYSYLHNTVDVGRFPVNAIYWHVYYLRLAAPLPPGAALTVRVAGLGDVGVQAEQTLTYGIDTTITPALKVNQAAYCAGASRRYAYLGWWAGDLGAVDFADCRRFEVVDEAGGAVALAGDITARAPTADKGKPAADGVDPLSGERVAQIDLAPLKPGRYHLRVPGLGRSWTFAVGGEDARLLARTVIGSLLTQRCGCDLDATVTAFPRPACHLQTYRHGHLVGGIEEHRVDGRLVVANPPLAPDEEVRSFRGGYHDAGDFDLFSGHLYGAAKLLAAYEAAPQVWTDGDLGLPESGNRIPDLLDEVAWGLRFYAENQAADGGVPAGRGNDEDYQRTDWLKDGSKEFGAVPAFGVFPPTRASSATFAAVAAQFARLVAPFDAARAADYRDRAERAWAWAAQDGGGDYRNKGIAYGWLSWQRALAWAAAELWETTGKPEYQAFVLAKRGDKDTWSTTWQNRGELGYFQWPYARAARTGSDAAYQQELRAAILKDADGAVASVERTSYRMGARPDGAGGWGDMSGGANHGGLCLYAWLLTRDVKYLDAASLNADWQLGCNPLSRTFITGVGSRSPRHPVLRPWLYDADGAPAPGVTVYGPGGGPKSLRGVYPEAVPSWRCWLDNPTSEIHSEFDAVRMQAAAAFYGLLWSAAQGKP